MFDNFRLKAVTCSAFFLVVAGASSCSTPLFQQAFKPEMESVKSNKVISDYCASCHVHKKFDARKHVLTAKNSYGDQKYSSTNECRICHMYDRNWMLKETRTTHRPIAN